MWRRFSTGLKAEQMASMLGRMGVLELSEDVEEYEDLTEIMSNAAQQQISWLSSRGEILCPLPNYAAFGFDSTWHFTS